MEQMPSYPVDRGNIVEYVETQLDPFSERPFCDVDSLVLSWLAYCRFPDEARGADGAELARLYDAGSLGEVAAVMNDEAAWRHLLAALVASPRFRGMRVCGYVEETDEAAGKQFSAVTLRFPGGLSYLAFRGTDDTVVGWREDFNMAFEKELPSQRSAVDYLLAVAARTDGPLRMGGHSKGGNLAVYAAMNCPDQIAGRIRAAYSHDGPGFPASVMEGPTWRERAALVRKTLPQKSLIGMLFERQEDYAVVRSTGAGLLQHDPFSWVVEGCDFAYVEELSAGARHLDTSINDWVASLDRADREVFVETLFDLFEASGQDSFHDITASWQTSIPAMLEFAGKIEPAQRELIGRIIWALVRELTATQKQAGEPEPIQPKAAAAPVALKVPDWLAGSPLGEWIESLGK